MNINYQKLFILLATFFPLLAEAQTVTTVKDISPTLSSEPRMITPYKNKLYFFAEDDTHGMELWQSDGTSTGTSLAMDYISGPDGMPSVYRMKAALNKLFFYYSDLNGNEKMMVTEGTFPTTYTLSNYAEGSDFVEHNGFIYFLETENLFTNIECRLMKSDGTVAGTTTVASIFTTYSAIPNLYDSEFKVFNNKIYFTIEGTSGDRELLYYDPVNNIYSFVDLSANHIFNMHSLHVYNNKLYCVSDATGTGLGDEIYSVDVNNTVSLTLDRNPGAGNCFAGNFFECNNALFFTAKDGAAGIQQHWLSANNASGSSWPPFTTTGANAYPSNHILYKGDMYFSALTDTSVALFKYNTTTNLIQWVQDISKQIGRNSEYMKSFFVYNDKLYFMGAKTGTPVLVGGNNPHSQLWQSDGTTAGTKEVVLTPTPVQYAGNLAREVVVYQGSAYFNGDYNGLGFELNKLTTMPLSIYTVDSKINFAVFPNPFSSNLNINHVTEDGYQAAVINSTGNIIAIHQLRKGANTIHLNSAINGVYMLQILDKNKAVLNTYKITKKQ
jgi:ELWxxDGT repeat protein